jgi:hypothetical protein
MFNRKDISKITRFDRKRRSADTGRQAGRQAGKRMKISEIKWPQDCILLKRRKPHDQNH